MILISVPSTFPKAPEQFPVSRVRGKVGCAMDQKKSKGSKDIQVLFTSLSVLGAGREQKEARITPSSILENDHQALGLFVGEEEGRKMKEKKRKRGEGNIVGKDEREK